MLYAKKRRAAKRRRYASVGSGASRPSSEAPAPILFHTKYNEQYLLSLQQHLHQQHSGAQGVPPLYRRQDSDSDSEDEFVEDDGNIDLEENVRSSRWGSFSAQLLDTDDDDSEVVKDGRDGTDYDKDSDGNVGSDSEDGMDIGGGIHDLDSADDSRGEVGIDRGHGMGQMPALLPRYGRDDDVDSVDSEHEDGMDHSPVIGNCW